MTKLLLLKGERLQKEHDRLTRPETKRKISIWWAIFWVIVIVIVLVHRVV